MADLRIHFSYVLISNVKCDNVVRANSLISKIEVVYYKNKSSKPKLGFRQTKSYNSTMK